MPLDNIIALNMSFGTNLRRLRRDKGWVQGELSERSGVKTSHISNMEQDKTDPKLSTIYKLINALNCAPDSLLMDGDKISLDGLLKASYDRAKGLPEEQMFIVVDLIDKYCTAYGLEEMMDGKPLRRFLFAGEPDKKMVDELKS